MIKKNYKKITTTISGKQGEDLAASYMKDKGFEVLIRNYRSGRAEIDLILKKENLVVFAEVKLRKKTSYGLPENAVDERKEELILDAAENYILQNDWRGEIRFDIISITGKNEIEHFEDAFG
ncbi:MAG: YraN family protein [Cytophagaceae bacterium]|nr:YraN family protein [Cytophagaceae bacterium]